MAVKSDKKSAFITYQLHELDSGSEDSGNENSKQQKKQKQKKKTRAKKKNE